LPAVSPAAAGAKAPEARDGLRVRLRVNGGTNGWEKFKGLVQALQKAIP